jgi:hypothetical protein
LLIETDPQGNPLTGVPALAGRAEAQGTGPFSNASLQNNSYVQLLERAACTGVFASAGQWDFSGATTLQGEIDVNKNGTVSTVSITSSGTNYNVAANGRGTVTVSSTRSYVVYLVSGSRFYVLESDTKPNGGIADQQTNLTTVPNGTLVLGLAQLATGGNDSSFGAQLVSGAAGAVSGIQDSNIAVSNVESQVSSVLAGTLTSPPDASGRSTAGLGATCGKATCAFYLVSPTKAIIFGTESTLPNFQPVDGVLENQ